MAAIPTSDLPGHKQLTDRVRGALERYQESQGIEFKESAVWNDLKWKIIRASLAMGNLRDGGVVVIGASERQSTWDLTGILKMHLDTYQVDTIVDTINSYVSPHVDIDILLVKHESKEFLVIQVHEFQSIPLACKKNGADKIEEGAVYVRPPGMARTTRVVNAGQMTELIQLAAQKEARKIIQTATSLGLMPTNKRNLFDEELRNAPPTKTSSIEQSPHWKVILRPILYEHELISPYSEILKTVQSCRVQLRGWDYPHISDNLERGENWIASTVNFQSYLEYWRCFQSGQFLHLFKVQEMGWKSISQQTVGIIGKQDKDKDPPGFFNITNLLYTLVEIYEFATRLCQRGIYKGHVNIGIELNNIEGFALAADIGRSWPYYCEYKQKTLFKEQLIPVEELIASTDNFALENAIWFYERFGWSNPTKQILQDDIASLRAGR